MGHLTMSEKERRYAGWMMLVREGRMKLCRAAEEMGVSYRQAKRIWRRFRQDGDKGLVHQLRGRSPNRQLPERERIVGRYRESYAKYGPTLASEKLAEEGLSVHPETLRRWLLKAGLWTRQRKHKIFRQRRERREQFGELIQIDGSIHDWFGDGVHRCLINMVDDATGRTLARLEEGETTEGVLKLLREWITRHGIPGALYVDLKNVYVSPKSGGMSQVQYVCQQLGIRIIRAHSPQAKGRVERNHAVYQDRFVKELALKKIKTIEEANALLANGFVDNLNEKFAKPAKNSASAHRSVGDIDLYQTLCVTHHRQLQNDWTYSFMKRIYQVKKAYGDVILPGMIITLRHHLDGVTSVWCGNQKLEVHETDLATVQAARQTEKAVTPIIPVAKVKDASPWVVTNHHLFTASQRSHPR